MTLTISATIPSFPARPVSGGDLTLAGPKVGTWFCEPKYNGWRALVHVPTGTMFNRHGKPLTIEKEFGKALIALCRTLDAETFKWVDCEALERRHGIGRGSLIVLDVLPEPAFRTTTYLERREWLKPILTILAPINKPLNDGIFLTPSFAANPRSLWHSLQHQNKAWNTTGLGEFYEGIVMKRADSIYPLQLRSAENETPYWVKHRWAV